MIYDAIVVGARCAGSPTAMLLARSGYRVLLVDRATFPSDTISTHYIHPPAIARAQRWGILERITQTCPPIHEVNWGVEGVWFTGSVPNGDGVPAYAPRRTLLDSLLVEAAVKAGVEVRENFVVKDLVWDDARVVGIRTERAVERARVVIGADGKRSIVARLVGAEMYDAMPTSAFWTYAYYSGMPPQQQFLYVGEGWGGSLGPTNDGLHLVMAGGRRDRMTEFRTDLEANSMKVWERIAPQIADLVRNATRETRIVGMGDLPGFYRKPYGPGWALVGDAGHHKDPVTAGGISDAWRQAELLAEALQEIFDRGTAENAALGKFERARNEANSSYYRWTCRLAALETVPESRLGVYRAMTQNRAQADHFTSLMAGVASPDSFWSDDNVARILAGEPPARSAG
jgi:flavin-dependent dehydrogenase